MTPFLPWLLAACGTTHTPPAAPEDIVRVAFTSSGQGEIEPCG